MKKLLIASLVMLLQTTAALAEEAPAEAAPAEAAAEQNVDAVLGELAKIGPEALLARVETLRTDIERLKAEAAAARQRAEELEAQPMPRGRAWRP